MKHDYELLILILGVAVVFLVLGFGIGALYVT